jgi:hypothetical protein
MVEQARLCNLLVDHMNQNQLSTSDSILPPSKLPMDLRKEEGKGRSHNRAFPEMDLSEWGITYKEFFPRKGKQSDDISKIDQLVGSETHSQAEILEERMRKSLYPYHQLCFKCGDRNHLRQSCPSSAWSDPRDWNILSRQGRWIGLSKDFLKFRNSLQQLRDHLAHGCPQPPSQRQAHQQASEPKELPPAFATIVDNPTLCQ